MPRPWDGVVSARDLEVYERAGFGRKGGFGTRPAVAVIDVQYRTVGDRPQPIEDAMVDYATACGLAGWAAIGAIEQLLATARAAGAPILYPYVAPKQSVDAGRLGAKVPNILSIRERGYDFVESIAPRPGDILLPKRHASAFFGTPMASYLIDQGVDTLIVTGCTTSGCVRASVADAFSYNFRVIVPEECVYDRAEVSHAVNLFDMHYKYADVVQLSEVIEYLERVAAAAQPVGSR
jgi:nicotinamidase-related amidase